MQKTKRGSAKPDVAIPNRPRRAQVGDVAKEAGVGVITVQRVFRGFEGISEPTREKVMAAAQRVGYSPSIAARSLKTGKVTTVAFVPTEHAALSQRFYSSMLAHFYDVIAKAGIDLLLSVCPRTIAPEAWLQHLVSSGRCGAVGMHLELVTKELLAALNALKIPVVILNYVPAKRTEKSGISSVGFDHAHGMMQAVRHLSGLGHRDIAYFGGQPGWQDSIRREAAFRRGMAETDHTVKESWIVPCVFQSGVESGNAAADPIFAASGKKPTAVICASDAIALGVMQSARKWGRRIPEDLSVIGFDDDEFAANYFPSLTTVHHSSADLGGAAATLLLTRSGNPDTSSETIILPTSLVIRDSTVPPH